ncbi:MAG: DUF882 domain-containing protein [Bacteroidetes bacterium]|nr:DUF882 domain-containing protein [Bacteroidota bacterium]
MKKKILTTLLLAIAIAAGLFFFYFNNLRLVNPKTRECYNALKDSLRSRGYATRLLVISTKRYKWHNDLQVKFSGAAKESRHLSGDAIDFIVFDINRDGKTNSRDVDIVYNILDKQILKEKGGIGTYKGESSFINRQMIHIDCRGYKARWAR